jgi:hypothetical protein
MQSSESEIEMNEQYEWEPIRKQACEAFSDYPDARFEQSLIDAFQANPAAVAHAVEKIIGRVHRGKLGAHAGWVIVDPTEACPPDQGDADERSDVAGDLRQAQRRSSADAAWWVDMAADIVTVGLGKSLLARAVAVDNHEPFASDAGRSPDSPLCPVRGTCFFV